MCTLWLCSYNFSSVNALPSFKISNTKRTYHSINVDYTTHTPSYMDMYSFHMFFFSTYLLFILLQFCVLPSTPLQLHISLFSVIFVRLHTKRCIWHIFDRKMWNLFISHLKSTISFCPRLSSIYHFQFGGNLLFPNSACFLFEIQHIVRA